MLAQSSLGQGSKANERTNIGLAASAHGWQARPMPHSRSSIQGMRRAGACLLLWLAALIAAGAQENPLATNVLAIKAGHLLDVAGGKVLEKQIVLVESDTIKRVGAEGSFPVPEEAKIVDLGEQWVLPGLIDCHTHITMEMGDYYADAFRKSPINFAVEAHVLARKTLEAGFTTCRDVGSGEFVDVALRDAIASGKVIGPRLFVAGHALSVTGGHGDLSGFSPYLHFDNFNGVV